MRKQHNLQLILLHVLHPVEYYSSLQFFEIQQPQVFKCIDRTSKDRSK